MKHRKIPIFYQPQSILRKKFHLPPIWEDGASYFQKIKNKKRTVWNKNIYIFFSNFLYLCFFRKCSTFRRSIPLTRWLKCTYNYTFRQHMYVYVHTKFQVSSVILSSFRLEGYIESDGDINPSFNSKTDLSKNAWITARS